MEKSIGPLCSAPCPIIFNMIYYTPQPTSLPCFCFSPQTLGQQKQALPIAKENEAPSKARGFSHNVCWHAFGTFSPCQGGVPMSGVGEMGVGIEQKRISAQFVPFFPARQVFSLVSFTTLSTQIFPLFIFPEIPKF